MKKRSFSPVFFLIVSLFVVACKPDFSVNSESEPFPIVYGLLSTTETTHYVKIFKSFLTEGNMYDVVKDINRYSYIDSIEVSLNEYDSRNNVVRIIRFDTTTEIPKDPGVFDYPTQILYKGNAVLRNDCRYELVIWNPYTKNITKVETPISLAGQPSIIRPAGRDISLIDRPATFVFYTAENALRYQLVLKYYYTEDLLDNTSRQPNPVVWNLGIVDVQTTAAGIEKSLAIGTGADFFSRIASEVKEDSWVKSRHTDSIVLEVHSAARDWGLYLQANVPTSGINQERLHYSNITSYNTETGDKKYAMGIFSSRGYSTKMYRDLSTPGSRDSLFNGRYTKHLKFTDLY